MRTGRPVLNKGGFGTTVYLYREHVAVIEQFARDRCTLSEYVRWTLSDKELLRRFMKTIRGGTK